jgi:hypothetical protein
MTGPISSIHPQGLGGSLQPRFLGRFAIVPCGFDEAWLANLMDALGKNTSTAVLPAVQERLVKVGVDRRQDSVGSGVT